MSSTNVKGLYMSVCHLCRLYKVHTPRRLALLCQRTMRCVSLSVHFVCECRLHTHHVGCTSANRARLDLDLPSYVPVGSEVGGDGMCGVCIDHVS